MKQYVDQDSRCREKLDEIAHIYFPLRKVQFSYSLLISRLLEIKMSHYILLFLEQFAICTDYFELFCIFFFKFCQFFSIILLLIHYSNLLALIKVLRIKNQFRWNYVDFENMCPLWRKVNFAKAIHGDSILKRIL